MSEILLPQLGETMEDAEIITWLKAVGDHVERGEPLLEVETDKIAVEVPALESGVLTEILVEVGESAKVGQAIAKMRFDGAQEEAFPTGAEAHIGADQHTGAQTPPSLEAQPAAFGSAAAGSGTDDGSGAPSPQLRRASPASRALARQLGIDLANVTGTGPRGRITTQDVQAAAGASIGAGRVGSGQRAAGQAAAADAQTATRRSFSRVERATARTTQAAFRDVPHFYVRVRVDVTLLMKQLATLREGGARVTVTDLITSACARTLRQHPHLNASVADDGVVLHPDINIGLITARPDGLVTTVIRRADVLTPQQVHERSESVRQRLAAGTAQPDDVGGGTFAVSNLGMFGVDEFSAIILPPNVAILAVGAVQDDVVVNDGALRFAKVVRLTLSADHRALGGVEAARFLGDLRVALEEPGSLLEDPGRVQPDAMMSAHALGTKGSPDRG